MQEDLKPLLQEIASELRTRNDLVRSQQQQAEQMRTEMMSNVFGAGEDPREAASKHLEESRLRMRAMVEDAEREREERRAFQQSLLSEIRRLNENLERLARAS
jgi:hypothetical protein